MAMTSAREPILTSQDKFAGPTCRGSSLRTTQGLGLGTLASLMGPQAMALLRVHYYTALDIILLFHLSSLHGSHATFPRVVRTEDNADPKEFTETADMTL